MQVTSYVDLPSKNTAIRDVMTESFMAIERSSHPRNERFGDAWKGLRSQLLFRTETHHGVLHSR